MISHTQAQESTKRIGVSGLEKIALHAWDEARDRQAERLTSLRRRHGGVSRAMIRATLALLARHASFSHGDCYPTIESGLAERLEISSKTVQRSIRVLEGLGLVDTLTGADAWAVYGRDPRAQDARRHAYRILPICNMLNTPRRDTVQDTRTGWQRHCARVGLRQQRRSARRELERLAGERGVMLLRSRTDVLDATPQTSRPTRRSGEVVSAATAVREALSRVHQEVDSKTNQPPQRGLVRAHSTPLPEPDAATIRFGALARRIQSKIRGANPPK